MIRQVVRSVCLRNSRLCASLGSCSPGGAGSVFCAPTRIPGNVPADFHLRGHSIRNLSSPKSAPTKPGEPQSSPSKISQMWQRFLEPKEMPKRYTTAWYKEVLLICTVFAVTGSSTMVLVRPAVSKGLGIQGSFKDGPWTYRICSLVIMSPIYSALLVVVGTVFGRHAYFRHFSAKMLSRFGVPPEMVDRTFHETKKTFRKW